LDVQRELDEVWEKRFAVNLWILNRIKLKRKDQLLVINLDLTLSLVRLGDKDYLQNFYESLQVYLSKNSEGDDEFNRQFCWKKISLQG